MGTPEFAATVLSRVLASDTVTVAAVYTQPDRPCGRGKKCQPGPVKLLALERGLPIHQPENFRDPAEVATLAAYAPDVLLVAAYGMPSTTLDTTVTEFGQAIRLLIRRLRAVSTAQGLSWPQAVVLCRLESGPATTADLARAESMMPPLARSRTLLPHGLLLVVGRNRRPPARRSLSSRRVSRCTFRVRRVSLPRPDRPDRRRPGFWVVGSGQHPGIRV